MSTQSAQEVSCGHCAEKYTNGMGIKGSFCSLECFYESKGENVLTQIQNDHRWCRSCFRRQKTIERPPEWFLQDRPVSIRDSIVGFEDYTEHVEKDHGFSYCECGTVNHRDEHTVLQDIERSTVITNLGVLLAEYYNEGQLGDKPDFEGFTETLNETDNHALAIGKAIYQQ